MGLRVEGVTEASLTSDCLLHAFMEGVGGGGGGRGGGGGGQGVCGVWGGGRGGFLEGPEAGSPRRICLVLVVSRK